MSDRHAFFAPCPRGTEGLLADELRRLGLHGVRPQRAGVLFSGEMTHAYRALLWSRLASRILLSLGDVDATSADTLHAGVTAMPWEDHVRPEGTIAIDSTGVNDALRNTQFTTVRVKDALADRFTEKFGQRPSVDTNAPDLRINVVVRGETARISIDLSGEPLHRRGYRTPGVQVAAPMKETLAAAVLDIAGWRETAAGGGAFLDPMCGSGTLAIEAALMAGDVAPGLSRERWGFDRWLGHDADTWNELVRRAGEKRDRGLAKLPPILASDSDSRSVEIAADCVRRAGLEGHVTVVCVPLIDTVRPEGFSAGLVACNPPYGERLSERAELGALYTQMTAHLSSEFEGWKLAVISSDTDLARGLHLRPLLVHELFNGRIPAPVSVFAPDATAIGATTVTRPDTGSDSLELPPPDAAAGAFSNRLRKMAKHVGTWARRSGVGCYRVYDADLPDYNLAVDVYTDESGTRYAHLAEYAPPADIDPGRASRRMEWATLSVASVLDIEPDNVFVKRRERQRGTAQYERMARSGVTITVAENDLRFEVNLSDYLDTGLFLDHRDTRAWLRELASGTRFLNLFAYTGTASVYAAAGGAASTTTVDLSTTYLDWAKRNFALNGGSGLQHRFERSDSFDYLRLARDAGSAYDLIFVDPPTFSNSKRTDSTFDVQRDHVALVIACGKVLAPGGTIVFSCNRRKFAFDAETLAAEGFECSDATARTIPKDFERTPGIHTCWTVRKAG
ncbi:MAG: bifunctional 23S rRNA (guanine(2069)-N(7))-methyltransferase RlmK/23S rRNA (guanine(2445)-N(2))-methyltransferase RlmL [Actinobacteria bacterium HGW-Actinobacteria-7]|nr:MAG: bifunctional 23S rRNA (guanine(2069)-N(7))-methyltransferase RlmK/23S rRNA (guanine(2445)-N(2))-methyltransferase RlmL [Actinobacteria bacterium HGW-Actinobacteria-7]